MNDCTDFYSNPLCLFFCFCLFFYFYLFILNNNNNFTKVPKAKIKNSFFKLENILLYCGVISAQHNSLTILKYGACLLCHPPLLKGLQDYNSSFYFKLFFVVLRFDNSILFCANLTYLSSISYPIKFLFVFTAATVVVPLPIKGSRIVSSLKEQS